MRRLAIAIFVLMLPVGQGAWAASASGNGALALAAIVAGYSPVLSFADKAALAKVFDGNLSVPNKTIAVKADAIVCRVSDVDITARSCELTFGTKKVTRTGRKAHELFATLIEVGVPPDGAAGTIFESLKNLDCSINLHDIKQKAGGGASCTFVPGP
jgi:hypothetical protein